MKTKIEIVIPTTDLLKSLDPKAINPKLAEAESELTAAKKQATDARTRLAELSSLIANLPHEIVSGHAPQKALEETIIEERSVALQLKAIDGKVDAAQQAVEVARAEGRAAIVDEANELLEHLIKTIAPVLPALKHLKDLEYEIEARLQKACYNPLTGTQYARKPSPALEWPSSVADEQAAFSWRQTAVETTAKK